MSVGLFFRRNNLLNMAHHFSRTQRIAQQIQRELADIIRLELKDPRVGIVTVTGVEVTRDYAHAKVFFTTLDDSHAQKETLEGLNKAAGFLRTELSHRLDLYAVPQLHFFYDTSVEYGVRLSKLIEDAMASSKPTD